MSSWENGSERWRDDSQQQSDWQSHIGGSAGGYSYFNRGSDQSNQSQTSWGYGTQKWEYQPPGQTGQSWSTVADDEWGFNNNSSPSQPPIGWGNSTEQENTYHGSNDGWGSNNNNRQERGERKIWGPPPRKRARNSGSTDRSYRKRQQRDDRSYRQRDYDYNYNQQDYGDNGYGNNRRWQQGDRVDWTEDYYEEADSYYYSRTGGYSGEWSGEYGDWNQVPSSHQAPRWKEDHYNEEDAYAYEYDFGDGYEGGYEDPADYHEIEEQQPQEEWDGGTNRYKRSSYNQDPNDKILYKKHRLLSQAKDTRKGLVNTVRNVMMAMKDSSMAMGVKSPPKDQKIEEEDGGSKEDESAAAPTNESTTEPTGEGTTETTNESTTEPTSESATGSKEVAVKKELPPEVLIGVVRVGPAKRKLLSKDSLHLGAELVAVYKKKPTKTCLNKLADLIRQHIKKPDKIAIEADEVNEVISIVPNTTNCPYPVTISFTSPVYGAEFEAEPNEETDPTDVLSEDKCVLALAKIRRVRWSVLKARGDLELPVVRIFLDLATQATGWKHLEPYPTEVLVHTVMEKLAKDVRETELTFSRLFVQCIEVLAEGLVLKGGPGMKDPCETQPVDVFGYLEPQQAEDLTRAAQHALRLVSFDNIDKLLSMES